MNLADLTISKLDLSGVKTLINWAAAEGWNPGLNDAELFYNTDPNGFYGYFLDEEMIAGGSIVSYNGKFGFMGLFIVKDEFRTQGIGRKIWHERKILLQKRLEPNAAKGMDGVVAMQKFYNKGGFKMAFRDIRFGRKGENFEFDINISPIKKEDLAAIYTYDEKCFGVPRKNFLEPWIFQENAHSFKIEKEGHLCGFAVLRKTLEGYKVGPLFADDFVSAEALYRTCLTLAKGENVYLDISENHELANKLVKKYNANYVFECARMYCGAPPKIALEKVFGITSFELG